MGTTKTKGERSKKAGGAGPAEGVVRSRKKTVAGVTRKVKAEQQRRSKAAQKAAATRKREAGYRERVAHERAKEQRAQAFADKRRAAKELATQVEAAKAEAAKALVVAQEEAARVAAQEEVTARDIFEAKRRVQQRRLEVQIVERVILNEQVQEIRTGREMLEEQVGKYYERAKSDGLVQPLSPRHASGKTWRHESRVRSGAVVDRKVGRFLREGTIEAMVRRLVKAAVKAKSMQPDGKLYVSFSIFEYGRNVPKSPGPSLYQDAIGSFWQAYEGTAGLSPSADIAGFEVQIRAILENRLRSSGSGNAILIDTFEVKSYYERTDEEQRAYASARRRERLAKMPRCGAVQPAAPNYVCDREEGHGGKHMAKDGDRILARWKRET